MNWKPDKNDRLTLHTQIVDWFTNQIKSGDFTPGMKCSPQRVLALQFEVNRSTINTAFEELKARGLIETRVGAGTFITQHPWGILSSHPKWQQHTEASVHKPNIDTIQLINDYEQNLNIIRLGTGELAPELLPTSALQESMQNIHLQPRAIGYSEPQGSLALRESLCTHLKKRGIDTSPRNILIVSGALQAFQLIALGLLERGSIIFQKEASYLNSIHPFQSVGMHLHSVKNNDYLKQTLQSAKNNRQSMYYSIPTLDNPTGRSWSTAEKEKVFEICRELSIPIIEDDVYHELLFEETDQKTLKSMDESGHVLYIGSVSKTLSPGLRIGWVVAPEAVIKRLADIKMQTDYGSSAFSQEIVQYWLTSGLYENHVVQLRNQLKQRALFVDHLIEQYFSNLATWQQPKGGFYIWLRFHEPIVTKALFLELLQQKVLINPGYIYQPNDFHHVRISYSYATFKEFEEGLTIFAQIIYRYIRTKSPS